MLAVDEKAPQSEELPTAGDYRPVFIMGAHRSGTTLLYQLLSETGRFNVVTAYHLICYDSFVESHRIGATQAEKARLADRFAALGVDTRLIDNVPATPDLPEEYGFLFSRWGLKPRLTPHTLPLLDGFCRKIQQVSPARPLLLKNPADFSNFLFAKQAWPGARFVFIHRHPYEVISSQLRSVRLLFSRKSEYQALFDRRYRETFRTPLRLFATRLVFSSPLGLRIVVHFAQAAFRYYLEHVSTLDPRDYLSMRYEDLCDDPDAWIRSILTFLALPTHDLPSYADAIQRRNAVLLPEVDRSKAKIAKGLTLYLAALGYAP